jgi:RIO kinase 1
VSYASGDYDEAPDFDEDEDDDEDDEEGEDDLEYSDDSLGKKPHHQAVKANGRQPVKEVITKHDPVLAGMKNAANLERKIDAGDLSNIMINTKVHNSLLLGAKKVEKDKIRVRSNRTDKSTSEQVMDSKTRISLLKMLNSGVLSELHGVINTGKEANVYHALSGVPPDAASEEEKKAVEYAVKIFKTSLNEFKNRSEYIEGEFRFRHRTTGNSRKLIKLWAEKEMRNLKRMQEARILCPTPIMLRENILVMSFLGKGGFPAPLLKDAPLTPEKLMTLYFECIQTMRRLYQRCKLVHGDLSEFNMMYFKSKLWIIDVSQAVENDHPKALEFLRRDCNCVLNFFGKHVDNVMTSQQLFNFITDIRIQDEDLENYLQKAHQLAQERAERELTNEEKIIQGVFHNTFIPRTLHDVPHPVAEVFDNSTSFHKAVTGLESEIKQDKQ